MIWYLPMSSQEAQTGRTDFVTEYNYFDAVTVVVGWTRGTLLYHPPLVSLTLLHTAHDLLKFDGHRPEETKVWTVRVICREAKLELLSWSQDWLKKNGYSSQKYSAYASKHKAKSQELTYVHPGCHFGLWSFGTPDELWQEGFNDPAR